MSIFYVNVENCYSEQAFMLEADDFISATMKAMEFLEEFDRKIAEQENDPDVPKTTIQTIQNTEALWMNETGMQECLSNLVVHHEEEE